MAAPDSARPIVGYSLAETSLTNVIAMGSDGSSGKLRTAQYQGRTIVIKRVGGKREREADDVEQYERERDILQHLDRERGEKDWLEVGICQFIDIIHFSGVEVGFAFERARMGDLHNYLSRTRRQSTWCHVKESILVGVTSQVLNGLQFLKAAGVVHLDVKPANILLYGQGDNVVPALTDFGISHLQGREVPNNGYVVTRWYRAPEIAMECEGSASHPADMWSVALVVIECVTRRQAFKGVSWIHQMKLYRTTFGKPPQALLDQIRSTRLLGHMTTGDSQSRKKTWLREQLGRGEEGSLQEHVVDFVSQILVWDPEERLTIEDALQHPMLTPEQVEPAASASASTES